MRIFYRASTSSIPLFYRPKNSLTGRFLMSSKSPEIKPTSVENTSSARETASIKIPKLYAISKRVRYHMAKKIYTDPTIPKSLVRFFGFRNNILNEEYYDENFKDTPLHFVTNVDQLKELIKILKKTKELGIDSEGHSYDKNGNIVHLIQLSTRDADYIIDPHDMRKEMILMKEIFENPKILKVGHSIISDIIVLNKAFKLRFAKIFDTYIALEMIHGSQWVGTKTYKDLVKHYLGVSLLRKYDRGGEGHNWASRRFSKRQLQYARGDSHFLLACYDLMSKELEDKGLHEKMSKNMENLLKRIEIKKPSLKREFFYGIAADMIEVHEKKDAKF